MPRKPSRRAVLTGALAAAAPAAAQDPPHEPVDDIAALERAIGREYGAGERRQIARGQARTRGELESLRLLVGEDGLSEAPFAAVSAAAPPAGKTDVRAARLPLPAWDNNPDSLAFASAATLGRLLAAGKVTSLALTKMYLARLKKYGPRLLCVVNLTEERALAEAEAADRALRRGRPRSPLHGVPYGLKDLFAAQGAPTTFGAKPFEDQVLDTDAVVVARLKEAGAVLLGKLTLGELAMGDVWFGGKTRCPWDSSLGSSGSSAGSAAAVAAGLVGFALGTETHGSIISPCVVNGTVGLRPTFGRVPRTGAMALSWSLDKIGPLCRSVEDAALILSLIQGSDAGDASSRDAPLVFRPAGRLTGLKVGIDLASKEQALKSPRKALYAAALRVLSELLGAELLPLTLPALTAAHRAAIGTIIGVEGAASFERLLSGRRLKELAQQADFNWPNNFRSSALIPAVDYLHAMQLRTRLQGELQRSLGELDAYVTFCGFGPSLTITNLTGHPTLAVRCGLVENRPVMLELTGALWREDAILHLGWAYEQATEHHKLWPDTEKLPEAPPEPAARRR